MSSKYAYSGSYHGIDISAESVRLASLNYPHCSFEQGDVTSFFSEDKYDLVNCTGVMQHVINHEGLLLSMSRCSNRYLLFDLKISEIDGVLADDNQLYCSVGDSKIHIVTCGLDYFLDLLSKCGLPGHISIFGYETKFNSDTVRPEYLTRWASVGVFVDLTQPNQVDIISLPDYLVT